MTPQMLAGRDPADGPVAGRTVQRREPAAVLGLAALAAVAMLVATGRSWLAVTVDRRPPFGPLRVPLTGHAQYPALTGLAVVALLCVVLVLVTGPLVRRVLGGLLALAGGWAGGYAVLGLARPGPARLAELLGDRLAQGSGQLELHQRPGWPVLTLLAAVLMAGCGVVVAVRGGRWQLGMSSRYAAPAVTAESSDPWRRLDRGEDPTVPGD
jgi:uncharacterized membrane protein (TIGR02234 family)